MLSKLPNAYSQFFSHTNFVICKINAFNLDKSRNLSFVKELISRYIVYVGKLCSKIVILYFANWIIAFVWY